MHRLRAFAKRVLPQRAVDWYRRRRQVRNYLKALGWELHERQRQLGTEEEIEERIAAQHDGFYQRMVREVLERTDLVLQQLDRRIEGVGARHDNELRALREDVAALRSSVESLVAGPSTGMTEAAPGAAPPTQPAPATSAAD
jgi:hypothetical protein